jgi:hypothetical protein
MQCGLGSFPLRAFACPPPCRCMRYCLKCRKLDELHAWGQRWRRLPPFRFAHSAPEQYYATAVTAHEPRGAGRPPPWWPVRLCRPGQQLNDGEGAFFALTSDRESAGGSTSSIEPTRARAVVPISPCTDVSSITIVGHACMRSIHTGGGQQVIIDTALACSNCNLKGYRMCFGCLNIAELNAERCPCGGALPHVCAH